MMTEPSDIYRKIAEKYGLTVEQVRECVVYFWRTGVKRSLEQMLSDEIYIPKLGSFKIKGWKLKYTIPQSFLLSQRGGLHEKNTEYYKMLNNRLTEVQKIIQEKEKKRNEFHKQHPRDIQESSSDMGGLEEQAV